MTAGFADFRILSTLDGVLSNFIEHAEITCTEFYFVATLPML